MTLTKRFEFSPFSGSVVSSDQEYSDSFFNTPVEPDYVVRWNQNTIEFRNIYSLEEAQGIFGVFSAEQFCDNRMDTCTFERVQLIILNKMPFLLIVVSHAFSSINKIWIADVITLKFVQIPLTFEKITAISLAYISTSMDVDGPVDSSSPLYYVFVTDKSSKLWSFQFSFTNSIDDLSLIEECVEFPLSNSSPVTSLANYVNEGDDCINLFIGRENGSIEVLQFYDQDLASIIKIDDFKSNGRIEKIQVDCLNIHQNLTLFASQVKQESLSNQSASILHFSLSIDEATYHHIKSIAPSSKKSFQLSPFTYIKEGNHFRLAAVFTGTGYDNDSAELCIYETNNYDQSSLHFEALSVDSDSVLDIATRKYSNWYRLLFASQVIEKLYNIPTKCPPQEFVSKFPVKFPYSKEKLNQIEVNRNNMKELFIDKLLLGVHISSLKLYPPQNLKKLKEFIDVVNSCDDESLYHFVRCYLFLDWGEFEEFEKYCQQNEISGNTQSLFMGYWHLDNHCFEEATKCFCNQSHIPWSLDIARVLLEQGGVSTALLFSEIVINQLPESDEILFYFDLLLLTNIYEAFGFLRRYSFSMPAKNDLFFKMCDFCFEKNKVNELLTLPFTENEEQLLFKYCTQNSAVNKLDFVMVYHIQKGSLVDALAHYKKHSHIYSSEGQAHPVRTLLLKQLDQVLSPVEKNQINGNIFPVPLEVAPLSSQLHLLSSKPSQIEDGLLKVLSFYQHELHS